MIVNEPLVAGVIADADADAWSVFDPTRLMLKSLNVALPVESVFLVSVPLNVPLPLANATVTGTPFVGIVVPLAAFSICTTTDVRIAPGFGSRWLWCNHQCVDIGDLKT